MNKNTLLLGIIVVLVVVGAIYFSQAGKDVGDTNNTNNTNQMPVTSGENPQPGSTVHDLPVSPAAAKARGVLASKLSVDEKSIVILQITEKTWNDGCLGLGGPAESCLQALVPGFEVELLASGKTYIYRTDATGDVVRAEE